jgi:hypothetical protein
VCRHEFLIAGHGALAARQCRFREIISVCHPADRFDDNRYGRIVHHIIEVLGEQVPCGMTAEVAYVHDLFHFDLIADTFLDQLCILDRNIVCGGTDNAEPEYCDIYHDDHSYLM